MNFTRGILFAIPLSLFLWLVVALAVGYAVTVWRWV